MRLIRRVENIASFPKLKMLRTLGDFINGLGGPDNDNRMSTQREMEAFIALQAVGEAVDTITKDASMKALVNNKREQLIAWVHYFYKSRVQKFTNLSGSIKDGEQITIKNLSATLFATFFPLGSRNMKTQIKSSYEVISGLWLAEDAQHPANVYPYASKILSQLLHRAGKDIALKEALLRSANGDADLVAQAAIGKLRKAMIEVPEERWPIAMHSIIVTSLASGRRNEIFASLHKHEIFTTTSKSIRLLSSLPSTTSSVERQAFEDAFGLYASVFADMITSDAENGTRALKQCIRYGALNGITEYLVLHSDGITGGPLASPVSRTISFLTSYLGIRTISIETINAFKTLPSLAKSMEGPSPTHKIWKEFVDTVMIHTVFVKLADIAISLEKPIREVCFHVRLVHHYIRLVMLTQYLLQCKQEFARGILQKCGGCKDVRYCSKKCQAEDWKIQHWYKCKHFANRKKYKTLPRKIFYDNIKVLAYQARRLRGGQICRQCICDASRQIRRSQTSHPPPKAREEEPSKYPS